MLALGCTARPSDDDDADATETGEPPIPTPSFTDPANLSKVVRADRRDPIVLGIADARDDLALVLDGEPRSLDEAGFARLADDQLALALEGSLIVLLHELVLVQPAQALAPERSEPLTIGVVASELETIDASAAISLGAAEHLEGQGLGAASRLGRITGEQLSVHAGELVAGAWAWASEPSISVALAGLAGDDVRAWTVLPGADELGVAWRAVEPERTMIMLRVGEADRMLARSDDPQLDLASLDALAWFGRTLVMLATTTRGEPALLLCRIDPEGQPLALQRAYPELDLDAPLASLPPILDLREASDATPRRLAALVGAPPWTLELSASGLPNFVDAPGDLELAAGLDWLGSFDGALGSRSAIWLDPAGPTLGAAYLDRAGLGRTAADELALAGPPSGRPALGVLAGVPTIVIPHADAPMQVVRSTGAALVIEPLAELACDEVALLASREGSRAGALPLACLRAGEVWLGSLALASR